MFDFEKLSVYSKAKSYNRNVADLLKLNSHIDLVFKKQFQRAAFSIMLNIAEGSGRSTAADKRNFYVIARGSVFECVAVLDYLKDSDLIDTDQFQLHYAKLEELSKMLFAMMKVTTKRV